MSKTGVIIKSDSFKISETFTTFENVSVNSVHIKGDDWRLSDNSNGVNIEDVAHYLELMAEGMAAAIDFLSQKGVDTEINLLQKSKNRIDWALFTACKIEENKNDEDYLGNELKFNHGNE